MKQIVKRDGRKVAFEGAKIENAIAKALSAAKVHDVKQAKNLAKQVEDSFAPSYVPTVEEVQDKVEAVLIENGLVRTAKEYILYRAERTRIRETNTRLIKTLDELTFKEARDNDVKRENANIDGDTAMGTTEARARSSFTKCACSTPSTAKCTRAETYIFTTSTFSRSPQLAVR